MHRVTRSEVAKRARVSNTTVSYVLSGRTDVSIQEETRRRVLQAAADLDYVPNLVARALKTGQTNIIGLWMSVLCPVYYSRVIEVVQSKVMESGYELTVTATSHHVNPKEHLERLMQWPVDGIIAFDSSFYVNEYVSRYSKRRVPIVSMGVDVSPGVDAVRVDLYPGAAQAVRHLIALGRTRIAFLGDRYGLATEDGRMQAYQRLMVQAGLDLEIIPCLKRSRASSHEAVCRYVSANGHPGALFCYNDDLAIGAQRALLDLGLKMPDDVAVVGHDGIEDIEFTEPRLSSVVVPTSQMCDVAWMLLRTRLSDTSLPVQNESVETFLRISRSSGGTEYDPPLPLSESEGRPLQITCFPSKTTSKRTSDNESSQEKCVHAD